MELLETRRLWCQSLVVAFLNYLHEVLDLLIVRQLHHFEQLDFTVIQALAIFLIIDLSVLFLKDLLLLIGKLIAQFHDFSEMGVQFDVIYLIIEVILDFLLIEHVLIIL